MDSVTIARDAALALAHAARSGFIHRDVKPSNLMRSDSGRTVMLDFGVAQAINTPDSAPHTMMGTLVGTESFLAPEIWNKEAGDTRSDLYGLGCTLYFMLVGKSPFLGGPLDLADAHRSTKRPSPREHRRDVTERLDALVRSLLAVRPEDRPQSGEETAKALGALLNSG